MAQTAAPGFVIKTLAWSKRAAPLTVQKGAGKCADLGGRTIKLAYAGYQIGGYRQAADAYNRLLSGQQAAGTVNPHLVLPDNPLVAFGKEFSKDEIGAVIAGAGATALANYLLDKLYNGHCPLEIKAAVLALTQPVFEKPMLVARHVIHAFKSAERTAGLCRTIAAGLKAAWPTLRADIIYHDSCQAVNMAGLTWLFNPADSGRAALLQVLAWGFAVMEAIGLEVKYTYAKARLFCRKLMKAGFEPEKYFELRFTVTPDKAGKSPQEILARTAAEFRLAERADGLFYHDRYFPGTDTSYNDIVVSHRYRERKQERGPGGLSRSCQVVLTKAFELKRPPGPYNCFPVEKEKYYLMVDEGGMPWSADQVGNQRAASILRRREKGAAEVKDVYFWRYWVRDPDGLLLAVDIPGGPDKKPDLNTLNTPFIVEVKARGNARQFSRINDFLIREFQAEPVTEGKRRVWS